MTQRLRSSEAFWVSASPIRALAESLGVAALVILLTTRFGTVLLRGGELQIRYTLVLLTGPFLALGCAARMRQQGPIWRGLAQDFAAGAVLASVPATLVELAAVAMSQGYALAPRTLYVLHIAFPTTAVGVLALAGFTLEFVGLRIGVRAWRHWNQLRRSRLRWQLTHAHLIVVLLGVVTLGALVIAVLLRSPGTLPLRLVPLLFMLSVFTVLALAVVLPPSALFSYLFARRTTQRLEALTVATDHLREGDYGVRVPVDGKDEVAQLQANFNAMAADLQRAVADLQEERDRVTTLLLARRELVASVSHELRTPLTTLRGYLESALTHWDTTPPTTLRHDLTVMDRETGHLQALINDLFTLARAEVGKLEMSCEPTDVAQLARHVVEVLSPAAWQSGRIELVAVANADAPLALVDAGRVQQILQNLLHNATRHTPPGGIVVVEASVDGDAVTLAVKDTGEGISAEDLPLIWQRFYRGSGAHRHAEGSSGLGLALVKELAEAMGGSVAASSTPGEGSIFTVRLPKSATSAGAARAARTQPPYNSPDASAYGAHTTQGGAQGNGDGRMINCPHGSGDHPRGRRALESTSQHRLRAPFAMERCPRCQ